MTHGAKRNLFKLDICIFCHCLEMYIYLSPRLYIHLCLFCLMPLFHNLKWYAWHYNFVLLYPLSRPSETTALWMFSGKRLIILLVASVLLLADPWQHANPEVTTTRGEKFPNILMLAWLKAYLRFVLEPGFSLVKQTQNEGEWGDKADVLIWKLSKRDKQETVLSLEHLLEAGAGWCCRDVQGEDVLSARRGMNWLINTAVSGRSPPDSQQIPDRLTPPEQWDESGDGFLCVPVCLRQTTSQQSFLQGCGVCFWARKLSQQSPGGGIAYTTNNTLKHPWVHER